MPYNGFIKPNPNVANYHSHFCISDLVDVKPELLALRGLSQYRREEKRCLALVAHNASGHATEDSRCLSAGKDTYVVSRSLRRSEPPRPYRTTI